MKLVYIANAKIPSRRAHSVHVMKICSAMAGLDINLHLVTRGGNKKDQSNKDPFALYNTTSKFSIHYVKWYSRLPGKYYLFGLMCAIRALLLQPDLTYGRFLFGVYFTALMGKTVVYESHSDEYNKGNIQQRMIRYLAGSPRCVRFVVISDALKRAYLAKYPELKGKIMVAHDGADLVNIPVKVNPGPFTVGYTGQLYPGKGMEIISKLVKRCPELKFVVTGGSDREVDRWKKNLRGYTNIKFDGHLPHHRIYERMANADLLLAPYQRNVYVGSGKTNDVARWMSPLKIFEYMAAGRPVIASDLPVIREVLTHEQNALLCDPDNIEEWVEAVKRLNNDPQKAKELARRAQNDIEKHYTWDKRAQKILNGLI